jgi:hypothetical protein
LVGTDGKGMGRNTWARRQGEALSDVIVITHGASLCGLSLSSFRCVLKVVT